MKRHVAQPRIDLDVWAQRLGKIGNEDREIRLNELQIPVISTNVILRKKVEAPFIGMVQTSTSVGELSSSVLNRYRHVLTRTATSFLRKLRS